MQPRRPHFISSAGAAGATGAGRVRRRAVGLAAAVVSWVLATVAPAGTAAQPIPEPDVWVASTRRLPDICRMPAQAGVDVERLSAGRRGRWERAGIDDLLAQPDVPLVIFIHGNRYAAAEAKSQGLRLARLVAGACPHAGPVRTVVFSWPSEQQGVLIRDVRAKYDRAEADGHYLASLLDRVDPQRPVAIVGYSYGAIVGLEALRDLVAADRIDSEPGSGASCDPGTGASWADRPGRTHLVLVAPAVRCDALAPAGPYRRTLDCIDRFTLLANSEDFALELFPCVDRNLRLSALGAAPMPRRWLPASVEYSAVDAADIVGRVHRFERYLESSRLTRRIAVGAVSGLGEPPADRE